MSGHCESSPRFVDSSNHLEGVGYCEEHADPVEGGGEVEEAGEPADAEDADQGHAALQLGHDLGLLVQVVVPVESLNHIVVSINIAVVPAPVYRLPGGHHGDDEDDPIDGHHGGHGPHEGPDEACVRVQPAVVRGAVPVQYSTVQYSTVQYSTRGGPAPRCRGWRG